MMFHKKNLILIGSAARKAGKTAFACRIILRHAPFTEVVGIKITTIKDDDPGFHGGKGGSKYHSVEGRYQILEETVPSDDNDTGRMLKEGASRVYWLKVRREYLKEGIEALLDRIPDNVCAVAEGTSARSIVEPGVFIVLGEKNNPSMKDSCAAVIHLADKVATFDGRAWDFPPEDCLFIDDEWMIRPKASAIVLAGGDSRRMGRDKGLLPVEGKPMIALIVSQLKNLFNEIVISANKTDDYRFLGLEIVPDLKPGQGPLMGIVSSLPHSTNDVNFVVACDIPYLKLSFASRLIKLADGYDMVLPYAEDQKYEPLFAVYRKSTIEPALNILKRGGRSIIELLDYVRVNLVKIPEGSWYRNINTASDYRNLSATKSGSGPPRSWGKDPA